MKWLWDALDFTEKIVTESGEFTDYYKGSPLLKSLDQICCKSFIRLLVGIKHANICIDDLLVSARGRALQKIAKLLLPFQFRNTSKAWGGISGETIEFNRDLRKKKIEQPEKFLDNSVGPLECIVQ